MNNNEGLSWYDCPGEAMDVVVSTRVRFARNLANFPFPSNFKNDDCERVQMIVFAAFSQLENAADYKAIKSKNLDDNGASILIERGVLENHQTGIIMRNDGFLSCAVNAVDHLRLSCFKNGLDLRKSFDECVAVDQSLQKYLQFAASYSFGYLTQKLPDCGSGIKMSARVYLGAAAMCGKFNIIVDYCKENKLLIEPAFPSISQGSAAGLMYQISTTDAFNGSELDQLATFESCLKFITETERKISSEYADNKKTLIKNSVIRAYTIAKFSMLISLREGIDIISDLKMGLRIGLISGIQDSVLSGLVYKIQRGYLQFLLSDGNFTFEEDILNDNNAKIDRLRALVMQEAFEHISLGNL